MSASSYPPPSNASTMDLIREVARQAGQYLRDLQQLFMAEAREKSRLLVIVAVSVAMGAGLLLFSFVLLTMALTYAIAQGVQSCGWALLIMGVVYGLTGALVLLPALRTLKAGTLRFQRTQAQVQRDKEWFKQKLAA